MVTGKMGSMRPGTAAPLAASGMGAPPGQGKIYAIMVTPGSDATTVTVWDSENSTTTNDTKLFGPAKFVASAKTELLPFVNGLDFEKGVYVEISGTAPAVTVYT
jgi:hypothetical protein